MEESDDETTLVAGRVPAIRGHDPARSLLERVVTFGFGGWKHSCAAVGVRRDVERNQGT